MCQNLIQKANIQSETKMNDGVTVILCKWELWYLISYF